MYPKFKHKQKILSFAKSVQFGLVQLNRVQRQNGLTE